MDASGTAFEIVDGDARAVVYEVGATLAGTAVGGLARTEPYPATRRPPKGAGAVLAPWPNRVRAGRWTHDGAAQQLPLTEPAAGNAIHGLLRHVPWTPVAREAASVTLVAVATVQPGWPQPVRVAVTYTVRDGDGLAVSTVATNLGDGPVPFGLGFHPYLRVGDVPADDLRLTLAAGSRIPLRDQLPDGPPQPAEVVGLALRGQDLDDAFADCAPDADGVVRHRVVAPDGTGTELWADPAFGWVQVFTPSDFPVVGRAVAVEPMTCPPDALNSGDGLVRLAPGESWTGTWGISALVE
jgi:aldose 1-epimerase